MRNPKQADDLSLPTPRHLADGFVRVRGARENNLRNVDVDVPRDSIVAFTGVSGSGKSSLAFGTIYAEAQRRYFESVAPYARRLIQQGHNPKVEMISGLPPAVALQQRRGAPSSRSTVGTVTTLSNSLRMLFSRAGTYPVGAGQLDSDAFSPNTAAGACTECHGLGIAHTVSEESLVPDPALTIREGAIAAWPGAWQGKNLRDILSHLGYDVDVPWRKLPRKQRDWILFTDEQPVVEVTPERDRVAKPYKGRFWSAKSYVLHTLADSQSAAMRERVLAFMESGPCPRCSGTGLRPEALAVSFAGRNIADLNAAPMAELAEIIRPTAGLKEAGTASRRQSSGEENEVAVAITADLLQRITVLLDLGLGYLALGRATPTLSPGEMQRLRIATQLRSGLFGVIYVLDEPSAGLHPADAEPLLAVLDQLKASGNSVFVVEHNMDVVRRADWLVDVGPRAGEGGGEVLYSGPVAGLAAIEESVTRPFLFDDGGARGGGSSGPDGGEPPRAGTTPRAGQVREPDGWLELAGISRHNLKDLDARFPLGVLTAVTGVSGSGKSTLVTHVLGEVVGSGLKNHQAPQLAEPDDDAGPATALSVGPVSGAERIDRLVTVDQKPIGRTPRSNLATYTGLFDAVRKEFAATEQARARGFGAGRFSFNVAGGRCETCQGEGFVAVELLFLPGSYGPCPECDGSRYNPETLEVTYRGKNVAEVLRLTVDAATGFLADIPAAARSLKSLGDVGLGYLRLGQPATELSGGEAQRIKLATELQRAQRGHTLYLLDEPTTGLHPSDVELLMAQLHGLVDSGNTVVVVEHEMAVVAAADWVIDLGPSGGDAGGRIVAAGTAADVAGSTASRTAPYLAAALPQPVTSGPPEIISV
ncbi:excinuclease ABC subunit UvrA [Pseudarthrobacter raffinosi]|uniref:excinuclease ABC subunit UvrA n=1 Tax=Pseudarthrobacter raffinosi TaxID=2953651 RepID=UPI00208F17CE|nr:MULTISPECIES: excinuclease ABC subunit UvrA [unclassified Pseudarthrobacter]MCO4236994.1 excinuclease ABC subunit UvrA [Pseudarthrobacter sp. MDT3-28]MCO4261601.1 excinuclease ABC subunit UvrA [Pseudarthrobacter sp. MDT3-26]